MHMEEQELSANEVRLVGRLSNEPTAIDLPSGDVVLTLRLVVDRPPPAVRPGARVDALECAVWARGVQRNAAKWRRGDVVEVSGAIRRRFFRTGSGGAQSRVEVEVQRGRVIRRAETA
ncbi:single-stranded DNA-binding protein [Nocardioides rotundus]|nr:single-stranded DNA-binding protein [Nocardioides rotundus]